MTDSHGLKTFELHNELVQEVQWKRGSIFISSSSSNSEQTETFYFDKKDGAKYIKALNLNNAKRKFNIL